jgi:very-short-patch-repair endonuclease
MNDLWAAERQLAELGAANDGILTSAMVAAAGISLDALGRARRRGVIVSVGRGVDRLRDHPFDLRSRCRAALALAGPGAVLGCRTAARRHGCWAYRDCEDVEVLGPRGRDHINSVGRYIETRWLPPSHVTMVDGFPVTTIARTFFDLCGDPDPGLHLRHPYHERRMKLLYNDCLGRRGMTFTMAVAVLSTLARRGRAGTRLVRKLLKHFGPKHEPTRSDVESTFFELTRARGFPDPKRQVTISGRTGFIGTVDFAWPEDRVAVEIDSSWHDGPIDIEDDAERDRRLRHAGYTVLRYRYGHLVFEPDRVARELAVALGGKPPVATARTVG